jgi:hypothetical protein
MIWQTRPLAPECGTTAASSRREAQFRASYDDTLKLLGDEAAKLGAWQGVIQIDVNESDIRRDGALSVRARPYSPAIRVSFPSRHGPLMYAADRYLHWQDNLRAVALALAALRAVDRYGVTGRGEQYRGWLAIDAASDLHAAARLLTTGLTDAWTVAEVMAADVATIKRLWRAAATREHPDHGGAGDLDALTNARDQLIAARTSKEGTR